MKSPQPVEEFLLPKALTTSMVRSPLALMRPLSGSVQWAGELLYILRPLVYGTLKVLLFMLRELILSAAVMLSRDRKSSRPLTVLVVMELLSRNLRRVPSTSATLERSEYARRDRDILWYLLRGSIWEGYTK
jgi:peroxin-16